MSDRLETAQVVQAVDGTVGTLPTYTVLISFDPPLLVRDLVPVLPPGVFDETFDNSFE